MNNMLSNFVSSVITNPITVTFLILITVYSIIRIFENKMLYNYIDKHLKEINEYQRDSTLYLHVLEKYNKYRHDNLYAEVNITTLTEEIASGLTYKNTYILSKIRALKNSSSVSILLGVLGTFVGLSSMLLTVNTNDIINSLPQTISSMQTAFTTSIFGIVLSLFIALCVKVKDCEHILIQLMLSIENLLTAQVTHAKAETMDSKIEDVKNTIKQISKSIEAIERFDKISKDLNEFNEDFISGIEALKQLLVGSESSINTFDQSVRKLDKQFNILNLKFGDLFEKYDDQGKINNEILLEIKECTRNIYDSTDNQIKIKDFLNNINSEFSIIKSNENEILEQLLSQENNAILSQRELSDQKIDLDATVKNLSSIVTMSSKDIQEKMDMIFTYIDLYTEALNIAESKSINAHETINTNPDEKYNKEEIYEIDNEMELNKNKKIFTVIKSISEDD